ncbi:unnamed protein product [Phyllotreta striolata]|uniref:TLC domain-containing protein n=1 Tax=Phyllotreta striolata TaxID=444603 RepID=A0A9N9XSH7_PHYSR|nr:unnamed protein product [Phyllotreta striolata]
MVKPVRKSSNKNPPILSHEYIIQNHADIVSCVAMVFVVGLMVQATSPIASLFITLQHNVTEAGEVIFYPTAKDWGCVFFYCLICIIVHAVIQEYFIDKVTKKLHLSKSKLAIFTTSGHLSIFYFASAALGLDIVVKENLLFDVAKLWTDYPAPMLMLAKAYIIAQLAYNLHEIPELYFQKAKKEEYFGKTVQSIAAIGLIYVPYVLNFHRLLVFLLVLHHVSEFFYHIAQLIQTVDKDEKYSKGTKLISNVLQLLARLGSIILAVLTLWYGLALGEQRELDIQAGYYNTPIVRLVVLSGILGLQMYLTFNVIHQELARSRENKDAVVAKPKSQKKDKTKKSKKSEESDLPEVDQNTNKTLKKQKVK